MEAYDFDIPVKFQHRVRFGRGFFDRSNGALLELLELGELERKLVVFVDEGLVARMPGLTERIETYFADRDGLEFKGLYALTGGEESKRGEAVWKAALDAIEAAAIDRHSFVVAVGGGAFLDVIGFAAATAHRGVKLLRFPTTSLSQDDSGVGVKNGINAYGKKNWLGAFAVPGAVVNDFDFLHLQPAKERRDGLVEAVKVALVKEAAFFDWIEANLAGLRDLDESLVESCVERSAVLHARHIAEGGDPFEMGSSRPLDFGHWAAHKLEQLTDFELSHAEAVGIGVALDVSYSMMTGMMPAEQGMRALKVLEGLGLKTWHPALEWMDENAAWPRVLNGLEEFREHLGGRLTVLFLKGIGEPVDLHEVDFGVMIQAMASLKLRLPCD